MIKAPQACLVAGVVAGALALLLGTRGVAFGSLVLPIVPIAAAAVVVASMRTRMAGNRQTRRAGADERAAALTFVPPEGMALLYVVRVGFVGRELGLDVEIDGELRTHLKAPRFSCVSLVPGEHRLRVSLPTARASHAVVAREETVALAAGEVVGFVARMTMGAAVNAIPAFERLSAAELPGRIKAIEMTSSVRLSRPVQTRA